MFIADDIALLFGVFFIANYSCNYVSDKIVSRLTQMNSEKEFLEKYSEFIEKHPDIASSDYVELTLPNRTDENLLGLCRQYYGTWTVNRHVNKLFQKFEPRVETNNYIAFRRVKEPSIPKPVRTEIVRCNKSYAVFKIGDKINQAYSLSKGKPDESLDGDIFYIHGSFSYEEIIPHSEAEQKEFESEFLAQHRDLFEENKENLQNLTISSNMDQKEVDFFLSMCKSYKKFWSFSKKTETGMQSRYLAFRRLDQHPGPVRVQMILCEGEYAIVQAEKGKTVYLLTKGKHEKSVRDTVFNIFAKLPYNNRVSCTDSPGNDHSSGDTSEQSSSAELLPKKAVH